MCSNSLSFHERELLKLNLKVSQEDFLMLLCSQKHSVKNSVKINLNIKKILKLIKNLEKIQKNSDFLNKIPEKFKNYFIAQIFLRIKILKKSLNIYLFNSGKLANLQSLYFNLDIELSKILERLEEDEYNQKLLENKIISLFQIRVQNHILKQAQEKRERKKCKELLLKTNKKESNVKDESLEIFKDNIKA